MFDTYPYLLPNLVCSAIVVFGLAVGVLFLEETHEDRKYDRDRGLEASLIPRDVQRMRVDFDGF